MKITPHHLKETIGLIVANAVRQYKQSFASYNDESNRFYRDSIHCSLILEVHKNQGHDRLQGIQYLLLEDRQTTELISKAKEKITEEYGFYKALLIAGKHVKNILLTDLKEVA